MEEFYNGKSIFLTGATGFVGKVLLEKMLRCLPGINQIYILVRSKGDQDGYTRLETLLHSPVFDRLKKENPAMLQKMVLISGDIESNELGISSTDLATLEKNVSIVIHSAATIKFNENLKRAINVNVFGTKRVSQLSRRMSQLQALVYVSTAYTNCDQRSPIQEKVYPVPTGSAELLESIDDMSEDFIDKNTQRLIGNKPNTYTFTKAIAEWVLEMEVASHRIPACILRPSMVTPSWTEPVPGWTDSYTGASGYSFAMGNGLLNIIYGNPTIVMDFTPVDMVANMTLVAAWQTAQNRDQLKVYNCCSGPTNPIHFGTFLKFNEENFRKLCPLARAVWYPSVTATLNRTWFQVCCFRYHHLPAWLIDAYVSLRNSVTGRSHRAPTMRQVCKNMETATKTVELFTSRGWMFERENVDKLQKALDRDPQNRITWSFNFNDFTWKEYMNKYCRGVRQFMARESDDTLPVARKRIQRLRWVNTLSKATTFLTIFAIFGATFKGFVLVNGDGRKPNI